MCLAAFQAAGALMSEAEFQRAWKSNPDGGGYAFIDADGKIVTRKFMKMSKMYDSYIKDVKKHGEKTPFIIHFRLATHGMKNLENCHPFVIDEHSVMIHNGILPTIRMDKNMSDSYAFAADYLSKLPKGWLDDMHLVDLVSEYCAGSKLVILTTDPECKFDCYIINEELGHWSTDKTMWFSNSSYCVITSAKYSFSKPAKQTAFANMPDAVDDALSIDCLHCGEVNSVYDDICYECESCQKCGWPIDDEWNCKCDKSLSIHSMSELEFIDNHGWRLND